MAENLHRNGVEKRFSIYSIFDAFFGSFHPQRSFHQHGYLLKGSAEDMEGVMEWRVLEMIPSPLCTVFSIDQRDS